MKKSSMGPECNPYFRESLEELSWPVMARALRQYLTRVAEDDGAIVRNRTDALEGLLRVLLPHSDETEAVRAALALLVQKGFLSADATSIFVRTGARVPVPGPVRLSTKRVCRHRKRLRQARLLATATTVGAVTPSCNNGGVVESLVEIKLFAELNPVSTRGPQPVGAKCVSGEKQ